MYFNYNPLISKGRVAIIRTIGMKIQDKKVKNNVNKPFNAVLIPESIKEDAFLKSLENESHTELSFEHIKDQKLQKNAKKFINNISKEIAKVIEQAIKDSNPTDGIMNTADVLYEIQNQFKKELIKSTPTVKLNKGDKETTIVKSGGTIPEEQRKGNKDKGKKSSGSKDSKKKKRSTKKVESNQENEERTARFNAHPDIVERVIIANNEYVKFDFSDSDDVKKSKTCDISLAVIDGMGNEYSNEFNMENSYDKVTDKNTGEQLKIENNLIKNVKITKGVAQIELKLRNQFNKALKFVYYVEV